MRHFLLIAAVVAVAGSVRGASSPSTDPFSYAVFGLADVSVAGGVRVAAGDVGVNLGALTLGPRAHVAGLVAADEITAAGKSRAGGFFCNAIDGRSAAQCQPVTVPLVSSGTLTLVQVLPGAISVDVGRHGPAAPLDPGDYGSVHVESRAKLVLAGGPDPYNIRDLKIGPRGRLVCATACRIAVRDDVVVAGGVHVEGTKGASVRIDVGAASGGTAFRAGPRARVSAVVYSPSGSIVLSGGGRYVGAFVGNSVRVGPRARVRAPAP